jgi:hypothetical protein
MGVADDTEVRKLHEGSEAWPNEPHNVSFLPALFVSYCAEWKPVNHVYFQLANTFFFLSYLAPNGLYGILYLRCTLLVGCAFFALWGWAVLCCFDAFLWNATFVGINFIHVCILLYYLRPVKFTKEVEEVSMGPFCFHIMSSNSFVSYITARPEGTGYVRITRSISSAESNSVCSSLVIAVLPGSLKQQDFTTNKNCQ